MINLLVSELEPLERLSTGARGGRHGTPSSAACPAVRAGCPAARRPRRSQASEVGSSMRAVAPPIQSFAMGRRR